MSIIFLLFQAVIEQSVRSKPTTIISFNVNGSIIGGMLGLIQQPVSDEASNPTNQKGGGLKDDYKNILTTIISSITLPEPPLTTVTTLFNHIGMWLSNQKEFIKDTIINFISPGSENKRGTDSDSEKMELAPASAAEAEAGETATATATATADDYDYDFKYFIEDSDQTEIDKKIKARQEKESQIQEQEENKSKIQTKYNELMKQFDFIVNDKQYINGLIDNINVWFGTINKKPIVISNITNPRDASITLTKERFVELYIKIIAPIDIKIKSLKKEKNAIQKEIDNLESGQLSKEEIKIRGNFCSFIAKSGLYLTEVCDKDGFKTTGRHHEANVPGLKVHALSSANSIRHES